MTIFKAHTEDLLRSQAQDLNIIVFSHILKDKCELKCHPEWVKNEAPIER